MASSLRTHPIHLGLGATAVEQPKFTGLEWYAAYSDRVASDGFEGRLVTMHSFTTSWDVWEMHPNGSEVVICTSGSLTLIQEKDGEVSRTTLTVGEFAINAPGVWHTADVESDATAVFITSGVGTEHRSRSNESP